MISSKHFCLIPAKGASTRLKKKNILKLNNKELIYYSISAALESKVFGENVYVSTELNEIRQIALKYGAKAPSLRDEKLAKDPYGVEQVALNFLDTNKELKSFGTITIILPTSPFVSPDDIIKAHKQYKKSGGKYLMSVVETDHNALRSVYVRKNNIEPVCKEFIRKKSQELENTYRINGAITIMDVSDFLKTKSYFCYPLAAYIMPKERSIDIDTQHDYEYAKFMMLKQTAKN